MSLTLVLGGTRSGKSAHAEALATDTSRPVRYVATADPADVTMASRIAAHVSRRPPEWETVLAQDDLAATVISDGVTLIDGLGTWLAGGRFESAPPAIAKLIAASAVAEVIVVAEQAGEGLLPTDHLARAWLDALGEAVQLLSAAADRVVYVVAGRPLTLPPPTRHAPSPTTVADQPDLRHHGDRDVRPGDTDHAVNVLAGGPPDWLRAVLLDALNSASSRYPDEEAATAAIAAMHDREPAEVVITNGAAEALWLLGPALRPRHVALIQPGFTETEAALRMHGIQLERIFEPDGRTVTADLVVVTNPTSPDGRLRTMAEVLALQGHDTILVVDEAFMSMVPGEPGSLVRERLKGVIVVRSLTKLLSVPGLRAGYALAPVPLANAIRAVRPPWSVNALALVALQAAASHPAEMAELARRAAAEREDLQARLEALPVRVWPSATNFVLIEVPNGPRLVDALRARRIAVRSAGTFPGFTPNHIRLTARDAETNRELVLALGDAL